jgi:hypothetical protein
MTPHALSEAPATAPVPPPAPARNGGNVRPPPLWKSGAVLLLGASVGLLCWAKPVPSMAPQAGVVMHLPGYVAAGSGFLGENAEETQAERNILPPDTGFLRKIYRDYPGPSEIVCTIVLSGAMQQSIHRPEVCLVAQGWSITNEENLAIHLKSGRLLTVRNLTTRRVATQEGHAVTQTRYNMYWFVGENTTTASHLMRVFLTSWDRIAHNRAHRWAYVTVAAPITQGIRTNGLDAAATQALMVEFIRQVVPDFQRSEMPDETAAAP